MAVENHHFSIEKSTENTILSLENGGLEDESFLLKRVLFHGTFSDGIITKLSEEVVLI